MHVLRCDQAPAHRPLAPGIERKVRPAGKLEHLSSIGRRVRQRNIARDGDDGEDIQILRRGQRQQKSDRVVLSGVGVDDDCARHAFLPHVAAGWARNSAPGKRNVAP